MAHGSINYATGGLAYFFPINGKCLYALI